MVSELPSQHLVVLFADLAESVRLFRDFERPVIERWHAFVSRVEAELAAQYRGRLVRSAGDGLLLEFASAVDATAASFALHQALEGFN